MKRFTSGLIIVLVILVVLFLVIRFTSTLDAMTDIFESVVIPPQCYEYLLTDGTSYYLLNSKQEYDGVSNPRKFKLLADANKFLLDNGCKPLPLINLVVSKQTEDPTDSYEKICSREVALNRFNADTCSVYCDSNGTATEEEVARKLTAIREDIERNFDNYSIEECMIKKVGMDDPQLRDPYNPTDENLQKFIKYFGQANEVIPEEYQTLG